MLFFRVRKSLQENLLPFFFLQGFLSGHIPMPLFSGVYGHYMSMLIGVKPVKVSTCAGEPHSRMQREGRMKKTQMARIVEFDRLVREGGYPNKVRFAVDYEVSERTIARDIEYLRDRLGAPLKYNPGRRGFYYAEAWELPAVVHGAAGEEEDIGLIIEKIRSLSQEQIDVVARLVSERCSSRQKRRSPRFTFSCNGRRARASCRYAPRLTPVPGETRAEW